MARLGGESAGRGWRVCAAALALLLLVAAPAVRGAGRDDLVGAESALAAGEFAEALRRTERAIAGNELVGFDLAQAHFLRAQALRASGRPQAAVDAFVAALHVNPRLAAAFTGLGRALDEQGRFAEAEQAYNRAVWLRPDLPGPFTARGDSYVLAGQWSRAIADYTRALQLDPGNAAAHAGLAEAKRGAQ